MNWYDYAGNDPVNHSDPSGLSCTATPNHNVGCHIDGAIADNGTSKARMKNNSGKIKDAENSMNNTYHQLMNDPNKVNAAKGNDGQPIVNDGKAVTITNSQMAEQLASRGFFVDITRTAKAAGAHDSYATTEFGGRRTYLEPEFFGSSQKEQEITYAHESVHGPIEIENKMFNMPNDSSVYDNVARHALWGPDN